jgi:hypothetical protein
MQRTKWTVRKFSFDFPEGWLPDILERLRGTSARISEITSSLADEETEYKPFGKWSIKENIGHLSDLEELHDGRIDDFIAGKQTLRAADMSNEKTSAANHNKKTIQQLLHDFSNKRKQVIERLEKLGDETQSFKSLHPRLQVMMRPVDIAFFTAEHDDHHLADIREIVVHFGK